MREGVGEMIEVPMGSRRADDCWSGGVGSMLTYVEGDLFASPAQTLVNTVNLVGVMGKGIALKFKQIYPEMFASYQKACETHVIAIGRPWLYRTKRKWILNFPTKRHWRNPSRIEDIEKGLQAFVRMYAAEGITSIAFPALGCGNGGLSWTSVKPLMEKYLRALPIDVYIYPPVSTGTRPEHRVSAEMREWLRSEPQDLPISEMWEDLAVAAKSRYEVEIKKDPLASDEDSADMTMTLITRHGLIDVKEADVATLWNALREKGFLRYEYVQFFYDGDAAETMWELLKSLDYVNEVVTYAPGAAGVRTKTLQIKLPPAALEAQVFGVND